MKNTISTRQSIERIDFRVRHKLQILYKSVSPHEPNHNLVPRTLNKSLLLRDARSRPDSSRESFQVGQNESTNAYAIRENVTLTIHVRVLFNTQNTNTIIIF